MRAADSRVLHLTWSGGIGGIERTVESLVLNGEGHRALFLDGSGPIGDKLAHDGRAEQLRLRGGADVRGLSRLAKAVRRLRPDIVHVHTHAVVPIAVARAALPSAEWVYQEHSPRVLGTDGKFRLLYALLPRFGARFVAPSTAIAVAMRGYLPPGTPVSVIPNACAVPVTGAPDRIPGEPPVVGVVARLAPDKRVDLLLDTVARLRGGGLDCRGLIVGDGPARAGLERHRDRIGLSDTVRFVGAQLDIVGWLDRMDVFLMTSSLESFGIAAIEAMARGVPVVAMPGAGGLNDHVARGGMLLADRSVDAAARGVGELLGSADLRRDCRQRGYTVAAEYQPHAIVARVEELYGAVLAGFRRLP